MRASIVAGLSVLLLSQTGQALVGGNPSNNTQQVVVLKTPKGDSFCSGALVGTSPVTILTAAHCLERIRDISKVLINGHNPVRGAVGSKNLPGMDLAVLIMGPDYVVKGAPFMGPFTLPGADFSMVNYRGPVKLCGYGVETAQVEICQPTSRSLKCGEGLYLAKLSAQPGYHSLYSYQFMQCEGIATQEELNSMPDFAEIMSGDSGGPLYVQENGRDVLVGIAHAVVSPNLKQLKAASKECELEHGRPYQQGWTSLTSSNPVARKFLVYSKEKLGADIKGL